MMNVLVELNQELKLKHWGPGEWINEPDSFEFDHQGLICFGHRVALWDGFNLDHLFGGYWAAYVVIPDDHPWHGKYLFESSFPDIEVHGDITYSGYEPEDWGDPCRFIIGFDCSHGYDVTPSMIPINKKTREDALKNMPELMRDIAEKSMLFKETYRTYDFVIKEVKKLADQVKAAYKTE